MKLMSYRAVYNSFIIIDSLALPPISQYNYLHRRFFPGKLVNVIRPGSLKGYNICEIGPGPGSITRELIKRNPEQLMVVEKDFRFLPMLQVNVHLVGWLSCM